MCRPIRTPVLVEHDAQERERGQAILADAHERVGNGDAQQVDVVDEARNQLARRGPVEERQIGADHAPVEAPLQLGDDTEPDIAHEHRLPVGGEPLGREDGERGERDGPQHLLAPVHEYLVDHRLDDLREGGGADRDHDHAQKRGGDPRGMRPHVLAQ
jgi:hypothetical protein